MTAASGRPVPFERSDRPPPLSHRERHVRAVPPGRHVRERAQDLGEATLAGAVVVTTDQRWSFVGTDLWGEEV